MTRLKLSELGCAFSLHKESEDPEAGFGYMVWEEQEVRDMCDLWNTYTQETCPHGSFLNGLTCLLCGNKYLVTTLNGGL